METREHEHCYVTPQLDTRNRRQLSVRGESVFEVGGKVNTLHWIGVTGVQEEQS